MDPIQTTQTESGAVLTSSRRDPPTKEPLVDVEIESLRGGQVYGAWQFGKGRHVLRIPRSKVNGLLAMVLDEGRWKSAVDAFETEISRLVKEARHNKDERSDAELEQFYRETVQSSPEAWYTDMYDEPIGVLKSAEVLEGEYAPPEDEERIDTVNLTAEAIAKALAVVLKQQARGKA